jgi:hypothetical protein
MNRLLPLIVALLVVVDVYTLGVLQKWRSQPAPPDLTPRVAQLETQLAQAQQDIGELKQEIALLERRGQPAD